MAQQRERGGVEIDADAVDAAFDGGFKRIVELALIDIVLILADADGLWIDFDQFSQRVLQAACDGDGAAHGEVEIGELLPRDIGGRVDGGAGFVDDDAEDIGQVLLAQEILDNGGNFTRASAVADGDGAHVVFRDQGQPWFCGIRRCRCAGPGDR